MSLTLYTYFRSSAAWRVRIVLALKGLSFEALPIHLIRDGGEQHGEKYLAINPQGRVPALVDNGHTLTQSLAICEYLEELHPTPALLPGDALARAQVRSLANQIACDIHPLNNLSVLQYLKREMHQTQDSIDTWYRHWVTVGFDAMERELARTNSTQFCVGTQVTLADVCLVPQVFNARRFKVDLTPYPHIVAIDAHLMTLPAFIAAQPSMQADAE